MGGAQSVETPGTPFRPTKLLSVKVCVLYVTGFSPLLSFLAAFRGTNHLLERPGATGREALI